MNLHLSMLFFTFKLAWFCLKSLDNVPVFLHCEARPIYTISVNTHTQTHTYKQTVQQVLDLRFNHVNYHYNSGLVQHVFGIEVCSITSPTSKVPFELCVLGNEHRNVFGLMFTSFPRKPGLHIHPLYNCVPLY